MEYEGVNKIHLAQDRNQWRALCEHGNKTSRYAKCCKFLDHLSDYYHLSFLLNY
jgi:hypothetical protein